MLRQRLLIVVFAIGWLLGATLADAQGPASNHSQATEIASGWWSPQTVTSKPRLMISMAELTRFQTSDLFQTSAEQPSSYRVAEPIDASTANLYYETALLPAVAAPTVLDPISPVPTSFLSLLQTNYANWESSLSDSRSLTDVNGASVYPLFQLNYAGWHLPVTLYISSLRSSNAW